MSFLKIQLIKAISGAVSASWLQVQPSSDRIPQERDTANQHQFGAISEFTFYSLKRLNDWKRWGKTIEIDPRSGIKIGFGWTLPQKLNRYELRGIVHVAAKCRKPLWKAWPQTVQSKEVRNYTSGSDQLDCHGFYWYSILSLALFSVEYNRQIAAVSNLHNNTLHILYRQNIFVIYKVGGSDLRVWHD